MEGQGGSDCEKAYNLLSIRRNVPDQRRAGEHYTKVSVKLGFEGFAISECYNTTSFYHFLAISNVGADRHFELRPDSESV